MINTQLGRRNLTLAQRIIAAEKYESIFREKAKENKERNEGRPKNHPPLGGQFSNKESIKKIHTDKEIAKLAGVGIKFKN